ncbi:MAG: glycosyltransferase family 39 protein, partial [Vicinamibacteria bacterium]|nr:glycosyltransferase family 39 protein [Vicinamibacteria bacterium]
MSTSPAVDPPATQTQGAWSRAFVAVTLLLIVVPFAARLWLIPVRGFNPDELEHLHFAWSIARGQVPYVDYFDHHTPGLHFLLATLLKDPAIDTVPDMAWQAIFRARFVMWLCAGATLLLTYWLARRCLETRAALLATLLINHTAVFLNKSFDIRPDGPATVLIVAALLLQLIAVRRMHARVGRETALLFASGLGWGAAIMLTQKALFFGPGLALYWLSMLLAARPRASRSARWAGLLAQASGAALPAVVMLSYFARHGALATFFYANVEVNARWPGLPAGPILGQIAGDDPAFVALATLGIALGVLRLRRAATFASGEALLTLALLAPLLGLIAHPAVTLHYFLLFLPLAALAAGGALSAAARLATTRDQTAATCERNYSVVMLIAATALSAQPLARLEHTFD